MLWIKASNPGSNLCVLDVGFITIHSDTENATESEKRHKTAYIYYIIIIYYTHYPHNKDY